MLNGLEMVIKFFLIVLILIMNDSKAYAQHEKYILSCLDGMIW